MDKILSKLETLSIKDIPKFNDEHELVRFIEYVFTNSNYLSTADRCKKTHQVFLQINNNPAYQSSHVREILGEKIVNVDQKLNDWSILKNVYDGVGSGSVTHSHDLTIVNFTLKLITSLNSKAKQTQLLDALKLDSLKTLKAENVSLQSTYFNLLIWYLLINKYNHHLKLSDYESAVPIIMAFGYLISDDIFQATDKDLPSNELLSDFNKIYRLIFLRLASLQSNALDIQDIIQNELETFILLESDFEDIGKIEIGDDENGKENSAAVWKGLLALLKNYQIIIQTFPKPYTIKIFQSELFLNFLNRKVRSLIQYYSKSFAPSQQNESLIINILVVFDNITLDESCTSLITKTYLSLLLELCYSTNRLISTLSSLIVVKCWNTLQQLKLDNQQTNEAQNEKVRELSAEEQAYMPKNLELDRFFDVFSQTLLLEDNNDNYSKHINPTIVQKYAIEGLAYISLKVKFKHQLRENYAVITTLTKILKQQVESLKNIDLDVAVADDYNSNLVGRGSKMRLSSELIYGVLLIILNIVTYNAILSKEEESIEHLKNYANANTMTNNDERLKNAKLGVAEKDDDEDIKQFLQKTLITNKIDFISLFNKIFKSLTNNIQDQLVKIIYNISLERRFRVELVKQGGLNLVLEYLINDDAEFLQQTATSTKSSQEPKIAIVGDVVDDHDDNEPKYEYKNFMRLFALRAVAKILISNNPNLVFKKYSVLVAIPFLTELLDDESNYVEYDTSDKLAGIHKFLKRHVKPLDVLESLLALTNLASMEDMKVKELIFNKSWKFTEGLVVVTNETIQKANLELISNLIFCPLCTSKFFNPESKDALHRQQILVKLINSGNIDIQIVVLTIFVNASEYEMVAAPLGKNRELFEKLITILNSIEEYYKMEEEAKVNAMLLRLMYLIMNIVEANQPDGNILTAIKEISTDKGQKTLKSGINFSLHFVKDEEVLAVMVEVCKLLRFI